MSGLCGTFGCQLRDLHAGLHQFRIQGDMDGRMPLRSKRSIKKELDCPDVIRVGTAHQATIPTYCFKARPTMISERSAERILIDGASIASLLVEERKAADSWHLVHSVADAVEEDDGGGHMLAWLAASTNKRERGPVSECAPPQKAPPESPEEYAFPLPRNGPLMEAEACDTSLCFEVVEPWTHAQTGLGGGVACCATVGCRLPDRHRGPHKVAGSLTPQGQGRSTRGARRWRPYSPSLAVTVT